MHTLKRELLFSNKAILERVKELASKISADYAGKEPILIGILNGAVFFFADLVRGLTIPVKIDFMRAASYGSGMTSSGSIKITKDVEIPIEGEDIIIVEDIVDIGLTLNFIEKKIRGMGPKSLKICALIDKSERRKEEVIIDYCGFEVQQGFLVGYGLDHDERYRYLPGIYVLE
ncbi:hypoxanthine phosphoribosyltransferase [Thermodesulfobacteriota bacterium]